MEEFRLDTFVGGSLVGDLVVGPGSLSIRLVTAPLYHLGRIDKLDDASSFALVQNQITFLDCKARNGRAFNDDEK
jgi:hypothetical protein